jgi:GTP cyclohydrolase II
MEKTMTLTHLPIKQLLEENHDHDCEGVGKEHICVKIAAIAELPTRFGDFQIVSFWNNRDGKEHAALVRGDVTNSDDVTVRLHSECLTGDAFGSLRCDCRDQLEASLRTIGEMDKGIVLYLRQEGRGIGFTNKIRAYSLQDNGYDTVEANLALGFRDDERDYAVAAHMLMSLKINSIKLMTNNPKKINDLTQYGIKVSGRIPLVIPPNQYNEFYLHTKAEKSGHLMDFGGKKRLLEQADRPMIKGMKDEQVDAFHE